MTVLKTITVKVHALSSRTTFNPSHSLERSPLTRRWQLPAGHNLSASRTLGTSRATAEAQETDGSWFVDHRELKSGVSKTGFSTWEGWGGGGGKGMDRLGDIHHIAVDKCNTKNQIFFTVLWYTIHAVHVRRLEKQIFCLSLYYFRRNTTITKRPVYK